MRSTCDCIASRFPAGLAVVAATLALAACSSLGGSPKPVLTSKAVLERNTTYWSGDVVAQYFAQPLGAPRAAWRDRVIEGRLEVLDARYGEFKRGLNRERGGTNLAVDLGVLALTSVAAVSGGEAANALAAGSAALLGAGAAVNRQLFYDKTIPALVSTMEANRKTVLTHIRERQNGPPEAYPLGFALGDLRDYEAAGSLDRAISAVTKGADEAEAAANARLQAVLIATERALPLQARVVKLTDAIRLLATAEDRPKLVQMAEVLGVDGGSERALEDIGIDLLDSADRIETVEDMDRIAAALAARSLGDF